MTNLNLKIKEQPPAEENLGSFYMGRMKPSVQPRRVLPKGMLTIVTLFSFAAILWYAYPRGQERYSDIDIPVIAADKAAYKFKPDDPGGMEVRHQDSTVFDPLEKKTADNVEKLRPTPEEPIAKPAPKASAPIDKTPHEMELNTVSHGAEKIISAPEEKPAPVVKKEEPKPVAAKPVEKPAAPPAKTEAPKVASGATPVKSSEPPKGEAVPPTESVKAEPLSAPVTEEPKPAVKAETKPAAKAAAAPVAKPAATPASGLMIQLGAYHDPKGAKAEWDKLTKKYPQLLKGLTMKTGENISPKGTLHRLQAGRVSESRAKEICEGLKKGGDAACMIVR